MKLSRLTILLTLALLAISCRKEPAAMPEPLLDVNANNISGVWRLVQWNGNAPAEGTYVYIEFTRRDQLFTIYQNLDSAGGRKITGRYNIYTDDESGAVIRGLYDYGNGDWAHRYIISALTRVRMTWTAKDDPDDVSVYERCEEIPADILEAL